MPGFMTTMGTTIFCAHGGQGMPTVPNPRVRIAGQPAETQLPPYAITGCPNTTPVGVPFPCVTALWATGSIRVKTAGQPLLLQDSQSLCAPTGTPQTVAVPQTRVRGI